MPTLTDALHSASLVMITPPRVERSGRPLLPVLLLLMAIGAPGCQLGPKRLEIANAHYSDAVRIATSEQLLVNLVRLRYRDQPVFLNVSSISTQFEFGTSGAVSGTFNESGPDVLGLGAGIDYTEKPTISFSILGGEEFQQRMLRPLEVSKVALLAESGWRGERVMRLTVNSLNGLKNAPTATGPTPSRAPVHASFSEAVALMRELSADRLISFSFETEQQTVSDPIPLATLEASDLIAAAKAGVEFTTDEEQQRASLVYDRRHLVLRFAPKSAGHLGAERLREVLRLDPDLRRIKVVSGEDSTFDPFEPDRRLPELGLETRSLMGILYYLSHGVDAPVEHIEDGIVTRTSNVLGDEFDWDDLLDGLFEVHTTTRRPKHASVAVRHRGHWFYIDDRDEDTKSTFLLLSQIFTLQAGEVEEVKPVLTLPVG